MKVRVHSSLLAVPFPPLLSLAIRMTLSCPEAAAMRIGCKGPLGGGGGIGDQGRGPEGSRGDRGF